MVSSTRRVAFGRQVRNYRLTCSEGLYQSGFDKSVVMGLTVVFISRAKARTRQVFYPFNSTGAFRSTTSLQEVWYFSRGLLTLPPNTSLFVELHSCRMTGIRNFRVLDRRKLTARTTGFVKIEGKHTYCVRKG